MSRFQSRWAGVGLRQLIGEHLVALSDEELDQAAAGGEVEDVVAADLGRDEQDRHRADRRRGRLVLDELQDLGAQHHGAGRRADRLAEAERAAVDRLGHAPVVQDVAGQRPGALGQAGSLGRHRLAQRRRVAEQAVGGGQRVDHLADDEPGPILALVVEAEPADGVVGHRRGPEVALEHPAVERVLGPGRVGEAPVAGLRGSRLASPRAAEASSPVRRRPAPAIRTGWRAAPAASRAAAATWGRPSGTRGTAPVIVGLRLFGGHGGAGLRRHSLTLPGGRGLR